VQLWDGGSAGWFGLDVCGCGVGTDKKFQPALDSNVYLERVNAWFASGQLVTSDNLIFMIFRSN